MKKPDNNNNQNNIHNASDDVIRQLIGMGKQSARKSYYPMLQQKINELDREKQKYKNLFDSISDAIFIISLDGNIIDANIEALQRYGYTASEFVKKSVSDIDLFLNDHQINEKIRSINQQSNSIRFETIHVTSSNHKINTEVTARRISYNNIDAIFSVCRDITDLKLTEEELQASQNQLQSIFTAAPCGIGVVVGRHFTYTNKFFTDMLAYEPGELLGQSTRIIYPTEQDYKRINESYKTIESEGFASAEIQALRKDSCIIDVMLNASPLDPNNIHKGITLTAIDITQLKANERALQKRVLALTQPLKNTSISIYELFDINELQNIQNLFADAVGVSSVITCPKGTPVTKPSRNTRFCTTVKKADALRNEFCRQNHIALLKNDISGPVTLPCSNCRVLSAGARITVGSKHIANWIIGQVRLESTDHAETVKFLNSIGVTDQQEIDAYFEIPTITQEHFNSIANSLYSLANQLSNTAYQNVQQAHLINESKKAEEIVKNYNLTLQKEVKQRTDELENKNKLLESEVEERIKTELELKNAQTQLVQSEKMASIGLLASNIAHEINTPLGAIGSSNTIIKQYFDDILPAVREYSSVLLKNKTEIDKLIKHFSSLPQNMLSTRIQRQLNKSISEELDGTVTCDPNELAELITNFGLTENYQEFIPLFQQPESETLLDLLDKIASIYQGNSIIQQAINQSSRIVFALKEYARSNESDADILGDVKRSLETSLIISNNMIKHGIELNLDLDDVPHILCKSNELCQVWTNLIHNAIQAMEGSGTLAISLKHIDSNIVLTFTDSGCGISPENIPLIFTPLFTTKPTGMGSGLGLDIANRIIERHNGKITVTSSPNQGSTFTITLPI